MKRLVLVGGGHAHVEVLRRFGAGRMEGVEIVLVTPQPHLIYTGMLPGHIAGHYALDECAIDLAPLAARAGAAVRATRGSLVSADARELVCEDGSAIAYDILSIDVGSRPRIEGVEGVERHAIVLRPLERFLEGWRQVRARAIAGGVDSITLVGGGAGGVELAFAINHALRASLADAAPHVRVVADTAEVLPEWPAGARRRARRRLEAAGIGVHVGDRVAALDRGEVRLASGITYATGAVFWTAGSAAPEWLRDSGLATDPRGFVLTDDALRSTSHPQVFAAGDCAVQQERPAPRAGVFAVRAGAPLAQNLRAALAGQPPSPHAPGERYLALLSTGGRHAIGAWGPLAFSGRWAWRWKDRIDRRWMARYREPYRD